jgi:MFS family permease
VVFLIVIMTRVIGTIGLLNFIPTYLVNALGLSPDRAALLAGLGFAGGSICAPILGRTADKTGPLPVLLIVTAALGPITFLFGLSTTRWLIPFFIIFFGGAVAGCNPPQNMILSLLGSKLGSGKVFGLLMAAVAVAQSFSPALFGILADRFGLKAAIRITSLPVLLSFAVLLVFSRLKIVRRVVARQTNAR